MSRHIGHALVALVVVALMCSTAFAQDQPVDPNSSTVDVVGCVRANPDDPAQGFVLADAADDSSSSLTPGARTDAPKRYVLVGDENDLVKLEGQRVRVSGRIVPSTKPEDQTVGTSGSDQLKPETQRLKVSAVEVIAGKCSPQ